MRLITTFIFCLIGITAIVFAWNKYSGFREWALTILQQKHFKTLEIRYSAENIMKSHKRELLKDGEHKFLDPTIIFHPYLLMEVKYNRSNNQTGEGLILWSLVDGEMVINTNSWEKTHGFTDCIKSSADRDDFKVINALSLNNGSMDRESLAKFLNVEDQTLDRWLDLCRKKNLIVQNGNNFRLHFQNPKLHVNPETKINQWLVTKELKQAIKIPPKYRVSQIESIAKAAFGVDFAIRKMTEVFLPVHSIKIQNPDGSKMTSYWNALNGKKLSQSYYIE
ncbi:MAG: hypothetical protein AMS24_04590 [Chlamydiae bacterium SM23_39]|nr:MAG: hypothetical protein AMS24_04590 [Chlamydiae bacterium SM23_39]